MRRFAVGVLSVTVTAIIVVPTAWSVRLAAAAPLPDTWCGDEAAVDRPDVVAQKQVHVVYVFPTDAEDRFGAEARLIARDLAGVDEWWRSQDPTRTPRFDLASFAGCTSEFGALDITSLPLSVDSATLAVNSGGFTRRIGDQLSAAHLDDATKKYLIYYDGPPPDQFCGISGSSPTSGGASATSIVFLRGLAGCVVGGGWGTGNGWPAHTAAHELLHGLNDRLAPGSAPNACDDSGHVCDSQADILSTGTTHPSPYLSDAILDVGHDDYYNHAGTWWDVRDSEWLMHLETPPGNVSLTVAGSVGGSVAIAPTGLVCSDICARRYDGGTALRFEPIAPPGYRLIRWGGACSGHDVCTLTAGGGDVDVSAVFGLAVQMTVRTRGLGSVVRTDGTGCSAECVWDLVPGEQLGVVARAQPGERFLGWRGLCGGSGAGCTVATTLHAVDPTITAVFAPVERARPGRDRREA